jgi:hypothetical protein
MRSYHAPPFLFVLFVFTACSRAPRIVFEHLTDKELVQQSPIIVIGRIEKLETFLNDRTRHGSANGHPLDWYRVDATINVENVLRGDPGGSSVKYTYWLPGAPNSGEWNSLGDGARYIHFLRRDRKQLRSVVDFWPSAIRVTSGRHQSLNQAQGLPQTIAQLLLSPGDDFVTERFDISLGFQHARALIGDPAALSLVEKLTRDSDARIRAEACEQLRGADGLEHRCGQ